ncbi:hypothetical protein SPI_03892 [Niveomyces insectorum RCEF 264]|uniref:Tat pathway signal sequence n=1 Tax=Niveomyces insectorum RCEF 264 TaxID=1081102 RepID=A0A167WFM1_9HYPO|nr:hypothetical protein SPI_03892 [Niveomyces insectorum RCEF 264]
MAPPGRRSSMRSVRSIRTLPIVHEDEVDNGPATPESSPPRPVRQKRHSGVVTAMPALTAANESGGSDEDGGNSGTISRIGSGRGRQGGSIQQQLPANPFYRQPARILSTDGHRYDRASFPYAQPANSDSSEESGLADRKLEAAADLPPGRSQNSDWFSKRGGWWRVALTTLLLAAVAVGLGLGIKFGLRGRSPPAASDNTATTPPPPAQSTQFPAGSYAFTVALTNVSTGCTNNGFAFGCYPSTVFSSSSSSSTKSQNASAATFYWVIAATTTSGSPGSSSASTAYTISSGDTPSTSSREPPSDFAAPSFHGVPMQTLDSGQDTERLVFNFSMTLSYVPMSDLIAAQTSSATCYFNQTTFSATIWTRRRATYPPDIANTTAVASGTAASAASAVYLPWPFAVEVAEVQPAGPGVPECLDYHGRSLGNFSVSSVSDDNAAAPFAVGQCGCWYTNAFEASNGTALASRTKATSNEAL